MDDVRGHRDDRAVLPQQQAIGEQQIVGPDRGGLEEAVAVLVFEDADAAQRLLALAGAVGIVAHLDDPESAVGIELHGDGALDLRLAGHQLDAQAVVELEELLRFLGRERFAGAGAFLGELLGAGGERATDDDEDDGSAHGSLPDCRLRRSRNVAVATPQAAKG